MKLLLFITSLSICTNVFSQQFAWGISGYINGLDGETYTDVDGNGTDLTISGFVLEETYPDGCLKTGVDDQGSDAIQHTYQLIFSQPVDVWFTLWELNLNSSFLCYNDQMTFSGNPTFSGASLVTISGNIVTPVGGYPANGQVTVLYTDVQNITIIHGAGTLCNPGHIFFCPLNFGPLSVAEFDSDNEIKIYPNPSAGVVQVEFRDNNDSKKELKLHNSLGEIVYEQSVNGSSEINLSHLNSGLYFLTIESGDQIYSEKIRIK